MLTALEQGVKGGKWFSLIDKVYSPANLRAAFDRVKANAGSAGVDHQTIAMFEVHLDANLDRLARELREGTYHPRPVRRAWIPKPGNPRERRPLGIPTVRDRVAQTALRHVLEPIFERDFAEHSYGFRPGRGCKDALRRVDALLKGGYTHVVDADLARYFDTISWGRLIAQVQDKVTDGRVVALLDAYLRAAVMDGLDRWDPEQGSPQGAVISPLLSNIYLDPLDKLAEAQGYAMVRYADDFVILCRSPEEAAAALRMVQNWTATAGLTLHPEKTRVVDVRTDSFEFLGYRFAPDGRWPRAKSLKKLKDNVRGRTRRANGWSLAEIIRSLNSVLRGWFEYYKHAHWWTFGSLDGWIRSRLRSILRRRKHRRGRARGADHQRWPNAYFAEQGLFSLKTAHAAASQSAKR
jgi:RNA-directed DNA polymerase